MELQAINQNDQFTFALLSTLNIIQMFVVPFKFGSISTKSFTVNLRSKPNSKLFTFCLLLHFMANLP